MQKMNSPPPSMLVSSFVLCTDTARARSTAIADNVILLSPFLQIYYTPALHKRKTSPASLKLNVANVFTSATKLVQDLESRVTVCFYLFFKKQKANLFWANWLFSRINSYDPVCALSAMLETAIHLFSVFGSKKKKKMLWVAQVKYELFTQSLKQSLYVTMVLHLNEDHM